MGIDWLTRELERVNSRPNDGVILSEAEQEHPDFRYAAAFGRLVVYRNEARHLAIEAVKEVERLRAELESMKQEAAPSPKFAKTYCSQCGREFGPGNSGYSHCEDHLSR